MSSDFNISVFMLLVAIPAASGEWGRLAYGPYEHRLRGRQTDREERKLTLAADYTLSSFLRTSNGHIPALGSPGI